MTRLSFLTALPFALAMAACSGDGTNQGSNNPPGPSQTGVIPEQLESIEVSVGASDPGTALDVTGVVSISGKDRDFTLTVEAESGSTPIAVHSAAASPLASLDGRTVEVSLTGAEIGGRSMLVSDDAGALYVAALGDYSSDEVVQTAFGETFATWGAEVGSETDGTFVWSYKKAVFTTDDGTVELLPGEVGALKVDGATWRVVVIASYQVGTNPDAEALPACSPEDMLAFEALRIETPAEEAPVRRLADAQVAYVGCTAPGGGE